MAIMTNKDLVERMYELYRQPNRYGSGGNNWSTWLGSYWYVDCSCSIKAILWGGRFTDDRRNRSHAGCNYGSNGIPDTTPDGFLSLGQVSTDFRNIMPGEVVVMQGRSHMGLYVGNGKVLEVTPAWTGGNPGCQESICGQNGERIKNGVQIYNWTHHVKLNAIDYIEDKPIELKYKQGDEVVANGYIYADSKGNGRGINLTNYIATITMTWKESGTTKPYNLDNGLGWIAEEDLQLYVEPKEEPIEKPKETPLESEKPQNDINIPDNTKTSENEPKNNKNEHNNKTDEPKKSKNAFSYICSIILQFINYVVKLFKGGK